MVAREARMTSGGGDMQEVDRVVKVAQQFHANWRCRSQRECTR